MVLCVSTARSSSRHPTGAVARVDWLMDVRARGHQHNNNGVCACVHVTAYPARLSDVVDARRETATGRGRHLARFDNWVCGAGGMKMKPRTLAFRSHGCLI